MAREERPITDKEAINNLPHNRKEVFFDLLRHRKMMLFALSSFVFLFFVPLAIDLFFFNYLESLAIASGKYEYLFSLIFYSMLIMIPCMVIGFVGLAGSFYTVKKMVWQEGISIAVDFFQGIKENFGRALINGLIFGIVLFGLVVGGSYLLIFMYEQPIWVGVGIGGLILLFIVFGIITALNFTQDVYYQNKYFITFKNSFYFLGLINWKVLLLFVITTGGVVALCAINMITLIVGVVLFAIFNSVVIVLYTLISHAAFDKYINVEHYPDMVGKGLYKITKSDKEA